MRISTIQPYLVNRLDSSASERRWMAGIIGDRPSQYAKSPSLWNAAFHALALDGVFFPFDVDPAQLAPLLEALRRSDGFVGGSVTVPYKVAVMDHLDAVDVKARQIGAVNTIARSDEGRLIGYNTDGQGFLDMVSKPLPGTRQPFCPQLAGLKVILIGAGGAARAVAFFLAEALGAQGELTIVNRDQPKATQLGEVIRRSCPCAVRAVAEADLARVVANADLIINASTKGQGGVRRLDGSMATCLEPYSALASAHPVAHPHPASEGDSEFLHEWYAIAAPGIEQNLEEAHRVLAAVPNSAAFVDLIYAPLETAMLRMARLSGHRILNGREMNVRQAADGFVNRVMRPHLEALGWDLTETYSRVADVMSTRW